MRKVLFVCLGNICRSPLAEGVFRAFVQSKYQENSILCDSAGTAGYHIGALPDPRSIEIALQNKIELKHRGRRLVKHDFDEFDFIVAMDNQNYKDILQLQKGTSTKAKILMMRDFDSNGKGDVPDPYYGSMKDFEEVYTICTRCSENLFNYILKS